MAKLKSLNEFKDSTLCLESEKMSKVMGGLAYPQSRRTTYKITCVDETSDNSTRASWDAVLDDGSWDLNWTNGSWIYCGDCTP